LTQVNSAGFGPESDMPNAPLNHVRMVCRPHPRDADDAYEPFLVPISPRCHLSVTKVVAKWHQNW
jgi:hypothetical protein